MQRQINKIRNKLIRSIQTPISNYLLKNRLKSIDAYMKSAAKGGIPDRSSIVVSLTSYGERLKTVHLCIESLLSQTIPPDRVVLYLDYDSSPVALPDTLTTLCNYGLEIRRSGISNLRGHKKYFYALSDFPDRCVVIADDDLVYPATMLSELLSSHEKFPTAVIARRTHRIVFDHNYAPLPYNEWMYEYRGVKRNSFSNFLTGGGGVLFPPGLPLEVILDETSIRRCALSSDDVWLSFALRASDIVIYRTPVGLIPFWEIDSAQQAALKNENVVGGGNDRSVCLTLDHFGLTAADFMDLE